MTCDASYAPLAPIAPYRETDPVLAEVLATLSRAGHSAHLVGGAVRDALLGRIPDDFDISTSAAPDTIDGLFANRARIHAIGGAHGTRTIVRAGRAFEITTWRSPAGPGPGASLAEDAACRDFTVNALYADLEGRIADPTGSGLDDLRAGRLRFAGPPDAQIRQDPLRLLRLFRFQAQLGLSVGRAGAELAAVASHAGLIADLPGERIGAEVMKLLRAPDPAPAWAGLHSCGLLEHLPGFSRACASASGYAVSLARLARIEADLEITPNAIRRLAALGAGIDPRKLRLSRRQTRAHARIRAAVDAPVGSAELGYRLGAAEAASVIALKAAMTEMSDLQGGDDAGADVFALRARLRMAALAEGRRFPLSARDFGTGLSGAALGRALRAAEDAWIDSVFQLDRASLRAIAAMEAAAVDAAQDKQFSSGSRDAFA